MKKTILRLLRSIIFLFTVGILLFPVWGHAAEDSTISLGLRGGMFKPENDDFKRQVDDGMGGINLNYLFSRWLEIGLGGMVQSKMLILDMTLRGRVDVMEDQVLVPFAGGGAGVYWVTGDVIVEGYDINQQGGYHLEGGIQILLDYFDPIQAKEIEKKWGVNNSYLSLGFKRSYVDGFGRANVDIGGDLFFGEILLEF